MENSWKTEETTQRLHEMLKQSIINHVELEVTSANRNRWNETMASGY